MYIDFSLDDRFLISEKNLKNKETGEIINPVDGKVPVKIKDRNTVMYNIDWLYNLSWYDVKPVKQILDNIRFIAFKEVEPSPFNLKIDNVINGKVMVFTRPIYYKEGFRYVPNYTSLAVDMDGNVIETTTDKYVIPKISHQGYLTCTFGSKKVAHHRLLALAWVKNPSVYDKQVVNHINGDKTDNSIFNLEWVTHKENNRHAQITGLNPQVIKVKMRNFYTKEVREVYGLSEAVRITGSSAAGRVLTITRRNPSRLFGEWEIKLDGDNSPWFYENRDTLEKHGRYHIEVTEKDGTVHEFRDVRDFVKHYKLWNLNFNVHGLVTVLKDRRPGISVRVIKKGTERKVVAYNIHTKEKKTYSSCNEAYKDTGVSRTAITSSCLSNNNKVVLKTWVFKYLDMDNGNWVPNWDATIRKVAIEVRNEETGEIVQYPTLREAERELGICRGVMKVRMRTGESHKGLSFKEICQ